MKAMKRAISVSLLLLLPLSVAGCGTTTTSRTASAMRNPEESDRYKKRLTTIT